MQARHGGPLSRVGRGPDTWTQDDVAADRVRPAPPPPPPAPFAARWLPTALLVMLGVGLGVVQYSAKPRPDPRDIAQFADTFTRTGQWVGRVAPDIDTTLLDGSRFRLADEVGRKVIVLNFFATWCVPCRKEMPELERFAAANREHVRLIGIDAREARALVEQFVTDVGVSFPVGIDGGGEILKAYDVDAYPTTVVIGAAGRVQLYEAGAISNADITLGAIVEGEARSIANGHGITRDGYLAALAAAPAAPVRPGPALDARAARIIAAMPCPCGCDDQVEACECRTAKGIKAKLAAGGFGDKTDAEIMEALNAEFCMKGM